MSIAEKAKTAGEIYNTLTVRLGLKQKELVRRANEKWVLLADAEAENEKLRNSHKLELQDLKDWVEAIEKQCEADKEKLRSKLPNQKYEDLQRDYNSELKRVEHLVEIILKELREKSVRVEKELGDAEKMKVVYVCEKCKLTFPQYPALRHCIQCGRELARLEALKQ